MRLWLISVSLSIILMQCDFNIAGGCNNHIYQRIDNKQKTFKIVKFDRGCGATTGNSIQLSLIGYNDSLPDEPGNIFISNSKVGGYIEKDTSVQSSWLNDTTILIKLDKDLEIFKKNNIVGKTRIIYEAK